jgi:FkbH-like protein
MLDNKIIKKDGLKEVKALVAEQQLDLAYGKLLDLAHPTDDYSLQNSYGALLKKFPSPQTSLKIVVLASSTVDHFLPVLKFWLAKEGFGAEFLVAEYGSVVQTILNPESELYKFQPDIIWIFQNHRDFVFNVAMGASFEEVTGAVDQCVNQMTTLWKTLKKHSSALIIQNNADIPAVKTFGNFETNVAWSRHSLLLRLNLQLASIDKQGVQIFDLDYVAAGIGKNQWEEWRFWYHAKHAFNMDAVGPVAFHGARLIAAAKGKAKKCIVLDLDNTLWGGVIGDDGIEGIALGSGADGEAFVDFQNYLLELKNRGIILTVCSKNEENAAKLPFLNHPDMKLKLEDISVFRANWNNKADNIRNIAESLNIGLDSIIFLDDNPAERTLVRKFLPMVVVPELPEDPTLYLETLHRGAFFETLSFSDEDRVRSEYYRNNNAREELSRTFENLDQFLEQLEMKSHYGIINSFYLPRAVQLINKSNQFNLTTIRYGENDIEGFLKNPAYTCLYFKLSDRFGDNGLISIVILKEEGKNLLIDTWVMSCRVLSRNMEEFILNEIVHQAKTKGLEKVIGLYRPTAKNALVKMLYDKLKFKKVSESEKETVWEKSLENANECPTFIEKIQEK